MADKYNEQTAKATLMDNGIKFDGKSIAVKRAGIKLWGAIDYLVNNHEYFFMKEERKNA